MAMRENPAIDVHAHTILPEVQALVSGQEGWRREAAERNRTVGADSLEYNRKQFEAIYKEKFFNQDARLADMDRMRIDVQTVSVTPSFGFNYWAERPLAEQIIELTNAGIAAFCARRPARFVGLGNLAMQFPELAATQLKRAIEHFHLKGVIVSTTVAGVDLADERFEPVWQSAEESGALVFIHPVGCAIEQRLTPYYLSNILGNPLETALALSHLIFSGILDRHPRLRLLAAHGGGFLPFYSGRFDHGWRVRPEAHGCLHAPSAYLRRIWFDSLVFDPAMLGFLISQVGADRIMLGTDYPMDMGFEDPLGTLEKVGGLSTEQRRAIAGATALALLGL